MPRPVLSSTAPTAPAAPRPQPSASSKASSNARPIPSGRWCAPSPRATLVFLHVRFTPAPKATPIVVGEIFRVKAGKLAEHWDIIQHAPEKPVNPNPVL